MKELFITNFGSKLYGTATPQSDTDIKIVVLPDLDDLIIGQRIRNKVKNTSGNNEKNSAADIDTEYIPIQLLAEDFFAGQTYAIEIVFSALSKRKKANQKVLDERFIPFVSDLASKFLTSNIKAMVGYATNQAIQYGIKGNRLGTVELFINEFWNRHNSPSFNMDAKFKYEEWKDWVTENSNKYLYLTTYENHNETHNAMSLLEKIFPFNISNSEAFNRANELKKKYGNRANDAKLKDGKDWKALSHAIRISNEACMILKDGNIDFPYSEELCGDLLDVKLGKMDFLKVEFLLKEKLDLLDKLKDETKLKPSSQELQDEFYVWLKQQMRRFYFGEQDAYL